MLVMMIMLAVNANALCWNPLEFFCIFGETINVKELPDYTFNTTDEEINISYYVEVDGEKVKPKLKQSIKEERKF